jgi:PGF-CTERM protein
MQRTMLVAAVVVLVVASGVGAAAAGAGADAAQDDTVTIELSVTTPGGDAIGNAEATIEWDGGSTTATTFSNGNTFAEVPDGASLEITLEHDEYVKNVPHTVSSASADQVVETTMYEPATAEVAVVDSDDQPVEDATVRLRKQGQSAFGDRGDTDGEGTFTSGEVEAGTYTVFVREPGYYDAEQTVDLQGETNTTVQIEQGEVTVGLLVQDPTPEGSGTLSADVDVTLDGERVVSATTNDQGRRSVVLEVNQDYDVSVSKDGYDTRSTRLRTEESDMQATFNLTRVPAISIEAGNEQVVVGENLRVEITDEYDRPVEGATVLVGGEAAGETDADGVARVPIDTEGEVQVSAEYEDLTADAVTVTGVSGSTDDGGDDDDGGTGDGSPGFGVVAALLGALAAVGALARRR